MKTYEKKSFDQSLIILVLAFVLTACGQKQNTLDSSPAQPGPSPSSNPSQPLGPQCIQIYYDDLNPFTNGQTNNGLLYANFLIKLLEQFPNYQRLLSPIELYKSQDIEKCQVSFYIGSDFYARIPPSFYRDFSATQKTVIWMGYSFWNLGYDLDFLFGYQYQGLTGFNPFYLDQEGLPAFFKEVLYKNQSFPKTGTFDRRNPSQFMAPYEVARLVQTAHGVSEVLAWSRHSLTHEMIPWALRAQQKYIISEVPFSYLQENDRHLVLADLLFDILQEPRTRPLK
jgi:uncharacterized protein YdaL